jgi:hypothetical protein
MSNRAFRRQFEAKLRKNPNLAKPTETTPCYACGLKRPASGEDPCFGGRLPGVISACCGHGIEPGYILFENGLSVTGYFRAKFLSENDIRDADYTGGDLTPEKAREFLRQAAQRRAKHV